MYGRIATVRSSVRSTDPAGIDVRRRVAIAVARRFRSAPRPMVPPAAARIAAIEGRATGSDAGHAQEVDCEDAAADALDARVRETGEW